MSQNNQITIEYLKKFISEGKVQGWVSHVWFNQLTSKFPFEFLFYSQSTTGFSHFRISTKQKILNNSNSMLEYILESRLDHSDIDVLIKIQNELKELYLNKKAGTSSSPDI